MKPVIGVDGCPGGWIAAVWGVGLDFHLCPTFTDILALAGEPIAVDMPIGFDSVCSPGGREAERAARATLERGRKSSVFPSPARAVIAANPATLAEANAINVANSNPPKRLSAQCFGLMKKLVELDLLMTPDLQQRVFESHPELAFWAMSGEKSVAPSKKTPEGHRIRLNLLRGAGLPLPEVLPVFSASRVARDDILDACACAWVARRILEKKHFCFPANPPMDAKGLRMEINA